MSEIEQLQQEMNELRAGLNAVVERIEKLEEVVLPRDPDAEIGLA